MTTENATSLTDAQIRQLLVYLTAAHMAGGAGAHEAHDEVRRAAAALGYPGVQVAATPNGVNLSLGEGQPATYEAIETTLRLDQTARLNAIQRGLETHQITPSEGLVALNALREKKARFPVFGMYVGGMAVATGISAILQPTAASIAFSAIVSPITVALMRLTGRRVLPGAMLPLFASFFIALAAFVAYDHSWIISPLRTMLPPVAVLLPGALITTGLSELVAGQMVSGVSRLGYGATQLVMFASGVAGAAVLTHASADSFTNQRADDFGPLLGFAGVVLLTVGITLMESIPRNHALGVLAVTTLTYAAQWGVQTYGNSPWGGALLGAFVASFLAWTLANLNPLLSRMVLFLPSFWLLVPGSLGLVSVTQLGIDPGQSWPTTMNAASVIVAISLGLVFGTTGARALNIFAIRRNSPV